MKERWNRFRDAHAWVRHVLAAYQLLNRNNGNQYAAAITYFSFLALFPLLLLAVAITGFVLHSNPSLETSLFNHVTEKVPGEFGTTLKDGLRSAIDARAGVGVIGLAGVLLSGLGWIGNLRGAIDGVWGLPPFQGQFLKRRLSNLLVLAGLGVGLLVSIALTVVGTSLTDQILTWLHIDDIPGSRWLLKILGIAIAVAGDMVIFGWLLSRLPDVDVDRRVEFRGALMAAIGFEVLKVVGTFTIAHTANSPTAGPFAGILAVLIWIQLVARWMLFCCAWMAVGNSAIRAAEHPPRPVPVGADGVAGEVADGATEAAPALSPAAVGAGLVGAGAVAGAVATWVMTRRSDDDQVAAHKRR